MKNIWLTIQDEGSEPWFEQWTGYMDSLDEETAADHIWLTLDTFNNNLRGNERPRMPLSFILEEAEESEEPEAEESVDEEAEDSWLF